MRKLLFIFCLSLLFTSCNDGDIITVNFDFDDTFTHCGELVFYKTKNDPAESLSLKVNGYTFDEIIQTSINTTNPLLVTLVNPTIPVITINSTNTFNYRTYSSLPSAPFCNDIPPADLNITRDSAATSGSAFITTTLTEDDNDGIPAADEDENLDGDNNPATNPTDTDGDGLPNYLDADDDGDNVLTKNEDSNTDGDNNPFTNPRNTDGDSLPDYLDADDDGDGVLTRDEENISVDQNPTNDVTTVGAGPDFLNPLVSTTVPATAYRVNTINQIFVIEIEFQNVQFPNITQQILDFGTLTETRTRSVTPTF